MSSHKFANKPQKITSFLTKISLPLGILLILTQGGIALAQVPNVNGFDDIVDLLNNQLPDLNGNDQETTSQEPEVIIESGDQGQESDDNGDVIVGNESDPRFTCEIHDGKYTVMYHPESQPTEAYPWAIPSQMGDGWSPERRCNVISSRLELYRPDGLVELSTGQLNGYDILCVTTEANPSCRIVLTVPVGQDPEITRDDIFESLTVADQGQETGGVYTFTEGNNPLNDALGGVLNGNLSILNQTLGGNTSYSGQGIYLKPFLDANDGGTGAYLNHNSSGGGRQLNPNIFR